ncbi:MAG: hypothetical protein RL095_201 [Verrucomicrobiota bacterium]|jgi:hypothetical protein
MNRLLAVACALVLAASCSNCDECPSGDAFLGPKTLGRPALDASKVFRQAGGGISALASADVDKMLPFDYSLRDPAKAKEGLSRRAETRRAPVDLDDVKDFNFLLSDDEDHGSGEIFVETEWGLRARILFTAARNEQGDFAVTGIAVAKRLSSFSHEGHPLKLEASAALK